MSLWATGGSWSQSLPKLCHVSFKDYLCWNPKNIWSQQAENFNSLPFTFHPPDSWPSQSNRERVVESVFLIIYFNLPSLSYKISTFLWSFLIQIRRILTSVPQSLGRTPWNPAASPPVFLEQRSAPAAPGTCPLHHPLRWRYIWSSSNSHWNQIQFYFCSEDWFLKSRWKTPPFIAPLPPPHDGK